MQRLGLEPVGIIRVGVSDLLYQRAVKCEMIPVKEADTINYLDEYFSTEDGHLDYSTKNSMQYKLLRAHNISALKDYSTTDYWKWHLALRQIGINAEVRTDQWIEEKIEKLIRVFEAMKRKGFYYGRFSHYPWVVAKPLINTRYGYDYLPSGYEILDGHHRVASAACLGYDSICVLLLRDVAKHTPFGIPLEEVDTP